MVNKTEVETVKGLSSLGGEVSISWPEVKCFARFISINLRELQYKLKIIERVSHNRSYFQWFSLTTTSTPLGNSIRPHTIFKLTISARGTILPGGRGVLRGFLGGGVSLGLSETLALYQATFSHILPPYSALDTKNTYPILDLLFSRNSRDLFQTKFSFMRPYSRPKFTDF